MRLSTSSPVFVADSTTDVVSVLGRRSQPAGRILPNATDIRISWQCIISPRLPDFVSAFNFGLLFAFLVRLSLELRFQLIP